MKPTWPIVYQNFMRYMGMRISEILVYAQQHLHIGLMFVPCITRRSRTNEHYALICTNPLFHILAPTCFGSSLPSSGSLLDPSELLEIQTE
jgi:hypothetical protein